MAIVAGVESIIHHNSPPPEVPWSLFKNLFVKVLWGWPLGIFFIVIGLGAILSYFAPEETSENK